MEKEVIKKYRCTQLELYSIFETALGNLTTYLTVFSTFKTKYDAAYIALLKNARLNAMELPDAATRNSVAETLRLEMLPYADLCTRYFLFLKRYIEDAFPENKWEIQFDVAGKAEYNGAKKENWEDLVGMNVKMKSYVANNNAVLVSNGFMPATFATELDSAIAAFDEKYFEFKEARQTSVKTAEKITANNNLWTDMMSFLADGQLLFANDAEKKKLFTYLVIKSLVSPPGSASLLVKVERVSDSTPIVNAKVSLQRESEPTLILFTNAEGALFENIDPDVYTVKVEIENVTSAIFIKEVNSGVNARLDVKMAIGN